MVITTRASPRCCWRTWRWSLRAAGLSKLVAETLATNDAMLLVFRSIGLTERSWYDRGQVHVELELTGESLLDDQADGRDWRAAVASLAPVLTPRHVVVVGAGRDPVSPGRAILANLLAGFEGRVSVVHPSAAEIGGVTTVARVGDLDAVPDLAVVAVPSTSVVDVIDECGRAGVRAAIVVSAGFAEEGRCRRRAGTGLLETARPTGCGSSAPTALASCRPRSD